MESLSIVPVEVLAMVSTQGGVQAMQDAIASSGNSRLHDSWQLAVTHLDTDSSEAFSQRDVKHVKKFRNLEHLAACSSASCNSMPGWQLVSEVAPSLRKLRSIALSGPSSFEVLKVLQGSEQLREQITRLSMSDTKHAITAADMYCLRGLKALAQLDLFCSNLPAKCCEAVAMASESLSKSLTNLELHTRQPVHPSTSAVFPGQISTLKKLELCFPAPGGDVEGVRATVAAVSALVDLQELNLELPVSLTAEQQQQALGDLSCLTRLQLSSFDATLALIPAADTLEVLHAPYADILGAVADALFSAPALREVEVWCLKPSDTWQGKVAEDCGIQRLELQGMESDDDLSNLPTMPALKHFQMQAEGIEELAPSNGRYVHLARFLHRHAASLEGIYVATEEEFSEVLPDLPLCSSLELSGAAAGPGTLHVLSGTQLPLLRRLDLGGLMKHRDGGLQLAWLARLPALCHLVVRVSTDDTDEDEDEDEDAAAQELREAVRSCLAGRPEVRVDFW